MTISPRFGNPRQAGRTAHGYPQLAAAAAILMITCPCRATTLNETLIAAYQNNPTLTSQRAGLRAVDEQAAIARSSGRSQLSQGR